VKLSIKREPEPDHETDERSNGVLTRSDSARASESTQKELQVLLSSIAPLLAGSPTAQSFHHLSAVCHKLVLPPHSLGPTIYTRVHEELENSIAALAREWRGVIMSREAGWLGTLVGGWRAWEARVVSDPSLTRSHTHEVSDRIDYYSASECWESCADRRRNSCPRSSSTSTGCTLSTPMGSPRSVIWQSQPSETALPEDARRFPALGEQRAGSWSTQPRSPPSHRSSRGAR
jgi:hypothetical protein